MKQFNFLPFLLVFFISIFILDSCKDDTPITKEEEKKEPVDTSITYTSHIKALMDANCVLSGCHTTNAPIGSMANYVDAKAFASAGRILGALNRESGFSPMPKNANKLSDSDIAHVTKWVNDGLPE